METTLSSNVHSLSFILNTTVQILCIVVSCFSFEKICSWLRLCRQNQWLNRQKSGKSGMMSSKLWFLLTSYAQHSYMYENSWAQILLSASESLAAVMNGFAILAKNFPNRTIFFWFTGATFQIFSSGSLKTLNSSKCQNVLFQHFHSQNWNIAVGFEGFFFFLMSWKIPRFWLFSWHLEIKGWNLS